MAGSAKIIDGKAVAARLRADLKTRVTGFITEQGRAPQLVGVLASDDPASAVYVKNKGNAAAEVGITATQHTLDAKTSKRELLSLIARLNADEDVDGILVQLPLPSQ